MSYESTGGIPVPGAWYPSNEVWRSSDQLSALTEWYEKVLKELGDAKKMYLQVSQLDQKECNSMDKPITEGSLPRNLWVDHPIPAECRTPENITAAKGEPRTMELSQKSLEEIVKDILDSGKSIVEFKGAKLASSIAKNPPEITIEEYMNRRINEFFVMHGIQQQDGPASSRDRDGTQYVSMTNSGEKSEGSGFGCLWHASDSEQMVDQFLDNLGKWLGDRKLVTWRSRPELCPQYETKIDREAMMDGLPKSEWCFDQMTGYLSIYCRLTAY
jgi:hypothetical protein